MFLLTEDNFCNKRVFDIKGSTISVKEDRYVIYKNKKIVLSLSLSKTILSSEVDDLREYMKGRYYKVERI